MAPTPHPHHQRPPNTHPPPLPPQHTPHSLQTPADLHRARTLSQARLKQSWERIFTRFSHDFTGIADEIDNATGALLVDNGHLRSLADANLPMDPADPDPEEDSFRIDKEEHCTQCADRDELDDAPCPHSDAPAETETVLRARGQGPTKEQILAWTPAHVHAHLSALSAQIDSCDLSFQLQKHNVSGRVLGGLARQELRSTLRLREEGVVRVVWGEVRRLQGILGGQEQEEGGAEEDKWAPPPRGEDPFYCAAWRDEHPDGTPEAFLRGKRRRGEEEAGGSKRVKVVRVGAPKEAAVGVGVGVGGGARKMAFEVAIPARTPTTTEQETPVSKKTPGKATPASRKHAAAETPAHAASSSKTQKSPTTPALKSILKKTGTPATAAPSEATTATTSTTTAKTPSKSTAKKTVSKSTPTPAPAAVAGSVTPITTTTTTTTKTAKVRTSISTPAAAVKESVSKAPAPLSKTPLSKTKTKALSKSTTTAAAAATPTAGPASRTRTPASRAAAAAAPARAPSPSPSPSPSPPSATTTVSIPKTPLSKSRSTPTTAPKSTTKTQKPKTPKTQKTKHPKTPKAKISEPETPGWTTSIARSKLKGQSFLGFAEDGGGYEDELASPGADEKERMRMKRRRSGGGAEKETEKEAVGEVVVAAGVSVGGEDAGKDTTTTENSAVATTTPAGAESAPTTPAADNVAEPARLVGGNRAPAAAPSGAAGSASAVEDEAAPPVVAAQKESSLEVMSKIGGKSTRPPHACNKRRGFCFVCMDLEGEEDDLI